MKKTINVYFDYICPYCYRGIVNLLELLPDYPELSVAWVPCESHPRPETTYTHSDLAGQAMLAAAEQGCDLEQFNMAVFSAHFVERRRIDCISVLEEIAAGCGADREVVHAALANGAYQQAILDNNRLVWGALGFEAVPCYQGAGRRLASRENVIISGETLRAFLDAVSHSVDAT